jgi:hypothetical protein
MKQLAIVAVVLAAAACNNKAKENPTPATGSSTAMSGSSTAMSGSSMAGSSDSWGSAGSGAMGSAMAGSGMGSGSAMADGSGAGAGSGSADSFNWEAMTHEQRMDYMKKTVVPTMKPLFQKFDAKHYANFGCKTCHGKDPKAAKFKMPTPDLPKLDFAALKAGKQKPNIAKWMGEVVKPQMATLLHMPEYTEANPKGFGCLECHMEKK